MNNISAPEEEDEIPEGISVMMDVIDKIGLRHPTNVAIPLLDDLYDAAMLYLGWACHIFDYMKAIPRASLRWDERIGLDPHQDPDDLGTSLHPLCIAELYRGDAVSRVIHMMWKREYYHCYRRLPLIKMETERHLKKVITLIFLKDSMEEEKYAVGIEELACEIGESYPVMTYFGEECLEVDMEEEEQSEEDDPPTHLSIMLSPGKSMKFKIMLDAIDWLGRDYPAVSVMFNLYLLKCQLKKYYKEVCRIRSRMKSLPPQLLRLLGNENDDSSPLKLVKSEVKNTKDLLTFLRKQCRRLVHIIVIPTFNEDFDNHIEQVYELLSLKETNQEDEYRSGIIRIATEIREFYESMEFETTESKLILGLLDFEVDDFTEERQRRQELAANHPRVDPWKLWKKFPLPY
jgi:hypothetical protein